MSSRSSAQEKGISQRNGVVLIIAGFLTVPLLVIITTIVYAANRSAGLAPEVSTVLNLFIFATTIIGYAAAPVLIAVGIYREIRNRKTN